jgi:hypothetical protein
MLTSPAAAFLSLAYTGTKSIPMGDLPGASRLKVASIGATQYKGSDSALAAGACSCAGGIKTAGKYTPVVFRILCHFFIISKKEMTYDQTHFRHRRRHQGTA